MHQVFIQSKSTVLLFHDVDIEDLKDLVDHIQIGTVLKQHLQLIALKYGFISEIIMTG